MIDDLPVIVVDEPRKQVATLSATFYGHPTDAFTTLGITGTQGKTTSTYLAEAALGDRPCAVVGTIGTRIRKIPAASALTTPEAPQLQALFAVMREEQVEVCAMEVSSHALVQGRVDGFAFDVAVFLNLGRDHLDFHTDLEDYFLAKAALFTPQHARHAVINVDDAVRSPARRAHPAACHDLLHRRQPRRLARGQHPAAPARHRPGGPGARRARDRSVGAAAGRLQRLQRPRGHRGARDRPATTRPSSPPGSRASTGVPGRMERVDAGQDFTAIVDYAHKPDAVTAVLSALRAGDRRAPHRGDRRRGRPRSRQTTTDGRGRGAARRHRDRHRRQPAHRATRRDPRSRDGRRRGGPGRGDRGRRTPRGHRAALSPWRTSATPWWWRARGTSGARRSTASSTPSTTARCWSS